MKKNLKKSPEQFKPQSGYDLAAESDVRALIRRRDAEIVQLKGALTEVTPQSFKDKAAALEKEYMHQIHALQLKCAGQVKQLKDIAGRLEDLRKTITV